MFTKKVDLTISCSLKDKWLNETVRPDFAAKFLPDWYKNLKPSYQTKNAWGLQYDLPTVRSCYGIKKTLTNGLIVPMWTDLIIEIKPDGTFTYQLSDSNRIIETHSKIQYGDLYQNSIMLKLVSPWAFEASKPLHAYITQPFFHINSFTDFHIIPGFFNFYDLHNTNVFIFVPIKQETYKIQIPVGYPLVQYIFTEDIKLKLHHQVIPQEAYDSIHGLSRISFLKTFDKVIKFKRFLKK